MPRRQNWVWLRGRQGFSLAEMALVISVLAILITVSMPSLFQFIQQRDVQEEENTQLEIRKALQAYLADKNKLPDPTTWSNDLAGYTNLSVEQISLDKWKRPRSYIMYIDNTRQMQGSTVDIYYATILSAGPNVTAEETTGIAVSGKDFAASTNNSWWSRLTNQQVTTFSSLKAEGDDILMRFTDYPEKLERYNLTLQRLDRISQALEIYAKNNYANKVVACGTLVRDPNTGLTSDPTCNNGMPEKIVYYPRSRAVASTTDDATYNDSTIYVTNASNDATRRVQMQSVMRMSGLPDEFCCSALAIGTDGLPKPFYYFSNPRPRNAGGGCGTRPGSADVKLPARLSTVNDDTASTNPTCG